MGINPSIYIYDAYSLYSKICSLFSMLGFKYDDLFIYDFQHKLDKRNANQKKDQE